MTPYYLVDVFAKRRYEGNPLAVFDDRAGRFSDDEMQQIAREVNYQETTFITGGSVGEGFRVRIFTPEYEVPFAGHPTLGTAWVLANKIAHSGTSALTLHLGVGPVPVTWEGEIAWLRAAQPQFGPTFDLAEVAGLLHVPVEAISHETPARWVSTGLPYLVIQVASIDVMKRLSLYETEYEAWALRHELHKTNSADRLTTALYVYTSETYLAANDYNTRMFCLENGRIVEDYATGSAASCLLAHLLTKAGSTAQEQSYRVEQGYEIGRPSLMYLSGSLRESQQYELRVGGQVQFVARGEWNS